MQKFKDAPREKGRENEFENSFPSVMCDLRMAHEPLKHGSNWNFLGGFLS